MIAWKIAFASPANTQSAIGPKTASQILPSSVNVFSSISIFILVAAPRVWLNNLHRTVDWLRIVDNWPRLIVVDRLWLLIEVHDRLLVVLLRVVVVDYSVGAFKDINKPSSWTSMSL